MNNIIITGANSTIGEEITLILDKTPYSKTFALYNKEDERIEFLKRSCKNVFFVKQNLNDKISAQLISKNQIIIHCAAKSHNDGSDDKTIYEFNTASCKNILDLANLSKTKKIIFLSSLSVYGEINDEIVTETTKINNPSTYGISKLEGENIFKNSQIPAVAIRLPGVLSIRAKRAWLPKTCGELRKNKDITIFNPNALFNNLIEASDLTNFIIQLIDFNWNGFHAFPIAAKNPIKIIEIATIAKEYLKSSSNIKISASTNKIFNIDSSYAKQNFNYITPDTKDSLINYLEKLKKTTL